MSKKKKSIEELFEETLVPEEEHPYVLPENWVWKKLEHCVDSIQYGYTETASIQETGPKFLRITDIQNNNVNWNTVPYCSITEKEFEKYKLVDNDIVIARTGATTGKSYLISKPPMSVFASYLIRLRCKSIMLPSYLWAFMKSPTYWKQIMVVKKGSTQPGANAKILGNLLIPLPPLNEQKRIADKVERFINKVEEANQLIQEAKETFELRRAAILDKAFRGQFINNVENQELKELDNMNYTIPSNWDYMSVEEVCELISDCSHSTPKYIEDGEYPAIRTSDVYFGSINTSKAKRVSEQDYLERTKRTTPQKDDVIYCREGTVGNAGIIRNEKVCLAQRVVLLRANKEKVLPKYFVYVLNSPIMLRQVFANISQTTSPRINISTLKKLKLPIAPIELQQSIVNIIETSLKIEQKAKSLYTLDDKLNSLKQSILFKAFRGELGTNDPSEESAIELLKEVLREQIK
ncbi:restriction endonuclease subunit S [Priestia megaterium]|uniref:restriction endonuclease subunit S n=1 Tax=Priestia megaterium TaxID=1404 RepID=UPI0018CC913A|nr:restriction endonuclease subunit S [Priestia megaterium]MBG9471367.1 hypothetical protein [Priestia megaterium]